MSDERRGKSGRITIKCGGCRGNIEHAHRGFGSLNTSGTQIPCRACGHINIVSFLERVADNRGDQTEEG